MSVRAVAAIAMLTLVTPASAEGVKFVAKVSAGELAGSKMRPAGDPRYVVLSSLVYDGNDARVDVLDLAKMKVDHVTMWRGTLETSFGRYDNKLDRTVAPWGELVTYQPDRAGLYISDDPLARVRRHWYVEVDPKTGAVMRSASIGTLANTSYVHVIGSDPGRGVAWFGIEKYDTPLSADFHHTTGPKELVLRRVDLRTLKVSDVMTLSLPARRMQSGYEDHISLHHAPDFSRFVLVEYFEAGLHIAPPHPRVYVMEPDAKVSWSIAALDTTYGVAFSPDGKYMYLASSRLGTIERVDLATQVVDKTVAGPKLTHHAIVSTNGSKLFVLGDSDKYTVYDLPNLDHPVVRSHAREVAPAAQQMFGGGISSLDAGYFVLPQALDRKSRPTKEFVVTRLVE